MSNITKIIGQRIRIHRTQLGISQEKLAELSGFHPTYIGQIERGEKNATLESIEKISVALNIPMSNLFENFGGNNRTSSEIPNQIYNFISSKNKSEQEILLTILKNMESYKNI